MNRKTWLSVFCVCSMFVFGGLGVETINPCDVVIGSHAAVTPASRLDSEWWVSRMQTVRERLDKGNNQLLFIGDSITHRWERQGKSIWEKYYAHRNANNMGFSSDRTEQVLWRLQNGHLDGINPKLAVVMIGTNNSNGDDYTAEEIADGIKAILCTLRTKLPDTKILILSIFPRGNSEQRKDQQHGATYNEQWAKNDKASQLASQVADDKMIFFLDINKAFLNEDGELTREVMSDLLHLTEKGYKIWAEAMEPTIVKLMGETK